MRTRSGMEFAVDRTVKTYTCYGSKGKSVLEQLVKLLAKESKIVRTVRSEHGDMVVQIDGVPKTLGAGGSGWIFEVDGMMPKVGASEYQTNNGERMVWKFVRIKYT